MSYTLEETYGQLLLSQLFTHIWFGEWDKYDATIEELPEELLEEFPFHKYYNREDTELWHQNYFSIPDMYYVPPYMSSYHGKSEAEEEKTKQDLLCLIGTFDKLGFYYPLEQEEFPDHIGSLTAFITAAASEEVKAIEQGDQDLVKELQAVKEEVYYTYLKPGIEKLWKMNKNKLADPFYQEFIPYYMSSMHDIASKN